MRRITTAIFLWALLGCAIMTQAEPPAAPPPPAVVSKTAVSPAEAELGRKTAEQVEKECKLIKNDAMVAKLNAIAADLAPLTQRPDVKYTCKILDDNGLNAMAIPGGTIYFTNGLIHAAESDDELAGVMAHEMAHNALYHPLKMMKKERAGNIAQIATVLAAVLMNDSSKSSGDSVVNSMQMLTMSEFVKQAILNGYSIDLETEADLNGLHYLVASKKYDPVGLYSVILGFKQMESTHAKIDYGYLKNHPDSEARLAAMGRELAALHIPINLWNVVNFRASVTPPEAGKPGGYTLRLGSVTLLTFTAADGALTPQARAQAAMEAINGRLTKSDTQLQSFEVRVAPDADPGRCNIRMRNTTVLTLIGADVTGTDLMNGTRDPATALNDLATSIKQKMQSAFFNENVEHGT
ncbi:MAG TPA: M48 family metalloprotease [Armatimonadota bacterium]|jgi:predicted SprT family Zn-dependent metalloprotease